MKVLEAAVSAAEAMGRSASIAVVDDGDHLLAFSRTDKTELYSIPICLAKARSAALTRFPSGKKSPTGNERAITMRWRSLWQPALVHSSACREGSLYFHMANVSARLASVERVIAT